MGLLVLTRKVGESIDIGELTKLTVLKIDKKRNTVRLGFDGSLEKIPIWRSELSKEKGGRAKQSRSRSE